MKASKIAAPAPGVIKPQEVIDTLQINDYDQLLNLLLQDLSKHRKEASITQTLQDIHAHWLELKSARSPLSHQAHIACLAHILWMNNLLSEEASLQLPDTLRSDKIKIQNKGETSLPFLFVAAYTSIEENLGFKSPQRLEEPPTALQQASSAIAYLAAVTGPWFSSLLQATQKNVLTPAATAAHQRLYEPGKEAAIAWWYNQPTKKIESMPQAPAHGPAPK